MAIYQAEAVYHMAALRLHCCSYFQAILLTAAAESRLYAVSAPQMKVVRLGLAMQASVQSW